MIRARLDGHVPPAAQPSPPGQVPSPAQPSPTAPSAPAQQAQPAVPHPRPTPTEPITATPSPSSPSPGEKPPSAPVTGYRLFLTAPWEKVSAEDSAGWGALGGLAGGVDVYRPAAGSGVPAALVVGLGDGVPGTGWEAAEVAGGRAVRRERPVTAHERLPVSGRRVEYAVKVPGGRGRWCVAVFSVLDVAEPLGATLVEWFDTAMGTFGWTYD
ncbi:hypothetical protein [Streptomyces sp. NRRL F-5630]|uniref:hypothetical protein n=1 Tax=Streptomyces sp. NRRL F-5630 TaxID=1463864 RepID=UPI001F45CE15|nr:hypothetical protein [Streptomyces sp. NRRL F-5630]